MDSAAVRGGATLPMPSSQAGPRKEWQTVPDNSIRQSNTDSNNRTGMIGVVGVLGKVQEGTVVGPLDDVDFCSITGDTDLMQQQLHDVSRRRGELQQLEIELQARIIARTEILGMQNSYNQQMKEQADATASLKQAWAKEDLLREQNKELATFRRERDNTEAERAQYIKQIHELQEHIREKEGQYLELEEQYAEMEQRYVHTIQQLQLELAETREKNGTSTENSQITLVNSDEPLSYVQNMGIQFGTSNVNSGVMSNENTGSVTSVSAIHASIKAIFSKFLQLHQTNNGKARSPQLSSDPLVTGSNNDVKGLRSNAKQYIVPQESQQNTEEISSQFHAMLGLKLPETESEIETHSKSTSVVSQQESLTSEPQSSAAMNFPFDVQSHAVSLGTESECNTSVTILPEAPVSAAQMSNVLISSKGPELALLEEGSLLACIVRAIPSGSSGQIKISTTLPNRLGKMLSPLHWHDYKKKYGKLDDFVARHPELFVIEGDFIHLREGAQEIISATAAVAKVAAVAAASVPYSSFLSSVAVTPVAQTHRLKLGPSTDTKPGKTVLSSDSANSSRNGDLYGNQIVRNQQANGVDNNPSKNLLNVKILNKSKDFQQVNGSSSEVRPGHSSGDAAIGNGARSSPSQNKGPSNGKHGIIFGSRQQGR
ncbi:hypothetical protein QJS10_CPB15g00848 [Acorus calamus]|uniref:DUF7725 domain-containing protein n=1 Tax=Acorus calamus TaxID=4465 RepID=A0AAV9D8Q6_ACOCL|nr:hypothetical protein QJS10_CPB15g00848 [Acorus calamus]